MQKIYGLDGKKKKQGLVGIRGDVTIAGRQTNEQG